MFKLPKVANGMAGPIKVVLVKGLKLKGQRLHGSWTAHKRTIKLNAKNSVWQMQHTYWHELTHAALDDSGQWNLLTEAGMEALCDLVASMIMREQE